MRARRSQESPALTSAIPLTNIWWMPPTIFAQAASEAGVRAVVNMSQISARREAKSHAAQRHWLAERLLDRTAMDITHIRPTFFAEWLPHQWSAGKAGWTRHDGAAVLRLPFGEGRHAPIAAADQGRFVAAALANRHRTPGKRTRFGARSS